MSFWQLDTWKKLFGGTPTGATPNATGDLSQQVRFIAAQFPIGGSLIDYQIFTASGTWNKPANARFVVVHMWSAGGGGGGGFASSGSPNPTSASAIGGQGGHYMRLELIAYMLPASVTVTVGAGGAGGASAVASSGLTAGGNGAAGSASTFHYWTSSQSAWGAGGRSVSNDMSFQTPEHLNSGTISDLLHYRVNTVFSSSAPHDQVYAGAPSPGSFASNTGEPGANGHNSAYGGGGGGRAGRPITAGASGGNGGRGVTNVVVNNGQYITQTGAPGGAGGTNAASTAGASATNIGWGGGAGGSVLTTGFSYVVGAGGNGALFGGGGAGGSIIHASPAIVVSAAGGNGGNGLVIVETYG